MPLSLKDLSTMHAEVPVEIHPELPPVTLTYRVDAAFDAKALKIMDEASAGNYVTAAKKKREFLLHVLTGWDITGDNGKDTLALTAASLDRLNGKVIDKMAAAVLGDSDPNLTKTASSPRLQAVE